MKTAFEKQAKKLNAFGFSSSTLMAILDDTRAMLGSYGITDKDEIGISFTPQGGIYLFVNPEVMKGNDDVESI